MIDLFLHPPTHPPTHLSPVIVATIRALKMHGGGPAVAAGKPLDPVYKNENVELVTAGCSNLVHHIKNAAKYGVRVIVAINKFVTDTPAEVEAVKVGRWVGGWVGGWFGEPSY